MRHAELAMYKAKEEGRDCIRFYDRRMNERARRRLHIDQALRQSIGTSELRLAYQPKVNLRSHRMIGAEALLRWQHLDMGALGPGEFIPLAEESGLIHPLTEFVIARACEDLTHMAQRAFGSLPISVNVSPLSFTRNDVSGQILNALAAHDIPHQCFEIEVTEQTALEMSGDVNSSFEQLHRAGVPIALDDFGTGYSSLQQLKALPLSCLKIDRSFVAGITDSAADRSIVRATISLARDFGLAVLAEGVETRAQESVLLEMNCDLAQGYLYARALAPEALQELVDIEI